MTTEFWQLEQTLQEQGTEILCGVDEAGRGPLAGPVCAAAVILPPGLRIDGLNDSKKLTERKREALYEQIVAQARSYCVVMVDEACIDRINILQATLLAMQQAVNGLTVAPTLVLVDGNQLPKLPYPARAIVKGDARCASIAAASILAKVTRDRKMIALDTQYPGYGFAVHKGYGTKAHYEALEKLGPCKIHRQSFLKKFYERS